MLHSSPVAQAAPNAAFVADVKAAKAAVETSALTSSLTISSMSKIVRSYARANLLRMKVDSKSVTLWNPKRPTERAIISLNNNQVSIKYTSAKLTTNDRRELELYSALSKSTELARTKSSVIFVSASNSTFARNLPLGSTIARRDRNGNISIVSEHDDNKISSVLLGDRHTFNNPNNWEFGQIAAINALNLDPNAQYLQRNANPLLKKTILGDYESIVNLGMRALIVQAFDSSAKVTISKTKQSTYYRVRSKVSSTATPGVQGNLTTTFLVRNGRISYALATPDSKASDYGTSVRISINTSSGLVKGLSGSITNLDLISTRLAEIQRESILKGKGELQRFLSNVVIADDASAIITTLAKFAADPSTLDIAARLYTYGNAIEWREGNQYLCGRLDLVAGVIIAEMSCLAAGYTRS
jgi:hypothetical protein